MANIAYNNIDNEALPSAKEHFYIGDHPKSEVKRGRPRTFSTDEERKQHYKNIEYHKKNIY